MNPIQTTPDQNSQIFTPLMICMVGLLFTGVAIVVYHLLLSKYCMEQRETTPQPIERCMTFKGVEEKVLESIPIIAYSRLQEGLFREQDECAVCLAELNEGVMVRLLPNCQHAFHTQCIDKWFFTHSNCPICRSPVVAPLETDEDHKEHNFLSESSSGIGDDLTMETRRNGLLHPCNSLKLPSNGKPLLPVTLNRSLSMDYSYVSVGFRGDLYRNTSSPSSSSKRPELSRSSSYRRRYFKRLNHMPSELMDSFSRLRLSDQGGNLILPR